MMYVFTKTKTKNMSNHEITCNFKGKRYFIIQYSVFKIIFYTKILLYSLAIITAYYLTLNLQVKSWFDIFLVLVKKYVKPRFYL